MLIIAPATANVIAKLACGIELEKKLDSHFFRAGRSALVNLKKISRVTKKEIYLQDGSIIPLPRGAYEKVNRAIINMD